MKIKNVILISMFILFILTISGVSATENITDDKIMENNTFNEELVIDHNPNITVPSKIWECGENEITIETNEESHINVTGAIDYQGNIQSGKTSIPLKNLNAGENNIYLNYMSNTTNLQKAYNITVLKDNPNWDMQFHFLSGEVSNSDMNFHEITENELSIMNLPDELTGNFSFYCNSQLWGEFEAKHKSYYDIMDLSEGIYNFTLIYSGDDYFRPVTKSEILSIQPIIFKIPEIVEIGYNDKIKIECDDYQEGNLTINIDGKLFKKEHINTKDKIGEKTYYTYDLSNLDANKTHYIEINYIDNYSRNITKKASVNVTDMIRNYVAIYPHCFYTYGINYNYLWFSAPDDLKNKLNVTINGKKYEYALNSQGLYAVNIKDVNPGMQTVTIDYAGDSKYLKNSFNATFEVLIEPEESYFYLAPNELTCFKSVLPSDCEGNMTLKYKKYGSNDYEFYKTIEVKNGNVNIPINLTHIGSYLFKTTFNGNYKINTIKFEIEIYSLGRYSVSSYVSQNSANYLTLTLPDDAYGNLTVEFLSNGSYELYNTIEIENGTASIALPTNHIGTYYFKAYSKGNYEINDYANCYTVTPLYKIKLKDNVEYNSHYDITLTLPEDGIGNLTLAIENITTKTVELKDGKAEISFPTNHVGKYTYNVYYTGNYEIYNQTNESVMIIPIYSFSNNIISVNGDLNCTGTLNINIYNPNEYVYENIEKINVVNGKALFDITELLEKSSEIVNVEIEYNTEKNESVFWYESLSPIKPNFNIIAKDLTIYYNAVASFKATIYKNNKFLKTGESVTLKIGSRTYNVNTLKNGIISKKIKLAPGKYTVKITYKKTSVLKKITVKHLVTLKTVKVKKSSKKLTLQATLKNKKAIKNKQITFKFNGKTYKAKTNSKGIAKVTIKKSILKKLKIGKKITYQATYLKDTVKKTAKVKK